MVRARDWVSEARAMAKLAWPIVLTQLAQMAVITTDVIMLGAYSKEALAASALSLPLFYGVWLLGLGQAMAVSPMVAHIVGARQRDRAGVRACVRMGLWSVILVTPLCLTLLAYSSDVLIALGEPQDLALSAGPYVQILSVGIPFSLAFNVLRSFSTALGHTRAPLVVGVLTVLFNAVADYALIFGHFGAPRLGLVGAGIASTASYFVTFAAMLGFVYASRELRAYRILRRFGRPVWPKLTEVFRLGVPIGLAIIFEAMFFNAGALIIGHFGAAQLAAHSIALNIPSVTFMVPLGIATAATVRIGLAMGARDMTGVRRAGLTALAMSAGFMIFAGAVLALFPREIAGLYVAAGAPENADVLRYAQIFLLVAAAFQLLDGLQVTAALSLRGMKDAAVPMWIAGGCYWLVGFPAAAALAYWAGLEGLGVWLAFALALLCAAVLLLLRFGYLSGILPRRALGARGAGL
jgi:MATE family multidrug resistance protein